MKERSPEATGTPLPEARGHSYTGPNQGHGQPVTRPGTERFERRGLHSREPLSRTEGLLIAMFVTLSAAILGAGALGYTSLSGQLLDLQRQIGGVQVEVGKLSERVGHLEERVGHLEERMIRVEERMIRVEERMIRVEERLTDIESVLKIHHGPAAGP